MSGQHSGNGRRERARRRGRVLAALVTAGTLGGADRAWCQDAGVEDHSAHHAMGRTATYSRTIQRYALPNVRLVDQDGVERALSEVAGPGRTVAVNFIFATCTTICPVMTATFARMRRELGSEADDLQMISISIDPEHDTPSVLASYAEPFGADDGWRFLTGELEEVVAVERAFDAYSGNKMSHRPLWFFRGPAGDEWVRIDGLASGTALADEYRRLSGR